MKLYAQIIILVTLSYCGLDDPSGVTCKLVEGKRIYFVKNTSGHDVELSFYPEPATVTLQRCKCNKETLKIYPKQATATLQKVTILQGERTDVAYKNAPFGYNNNSKVRRPEHGGVLLWQLGGLSPFNYGIVYEKVVFVFSGGKRIEYFFGGVDSRSILQRTGFVETKRSGGISPDHPCASDGGLKYTQDVEYTYTLTEEDYQRAK